MGPFYILMIAVFSCIILVGRETVRQVLGRTQQ